MNRILDTSESDEDLLREPPKKKKEEPRRDLLCILEKKKRKIAKNSTAENLKQCTSKKSNREAAVDTVTEAHHKIARLEEVKEKDAVICDLESQIEAKDAEILQLRKLNLGLQDKILSRLDASEGHRPMSHALHATQSSTPGAANTTRSLSPLLQPIHVPTPAPPEQLTTADEMVDIGQGLCIHREAWERIQGQKKKIPSLSRSSC